MNFFRLLNQIKKRIPSGLILVLIVLLSNDALSQCVPAPVPNDACYNTVITNDTYCCNTAWDAICQNAYDNCIGGPPPCVPAPVPNDACYNTVITNDPYCCNTAWDAICQSAYDACSGGGGGGPGPCASITPLIGCGTSTNASMSGTGAGWDMAAICGFNTPGTEMIFSFTATASGIHQLNVTGTSGGFVDFMWVNSTSGCSAGAPWNCIGDIFSPGTYGSMNWVAGNTYYILLDPEGTGAYSFTFDIDCPNPGTPAVAGDCAVAIPVCTDLGFSIDPSGFGLVDELCVGCVTNPSTNPSSGNFGCLNAGELNSTWFTVNVSAGGTLEFSFGVPGTIGNCYDWIMWPYDPTACAAIMANTLPPTTCNWNSPCDGFTGVGNTLPPGGMAGNFEPTINVSAGDQFVICFSNYSSALTTVPLNFTGSADISCTLLPVELIGFSGTAKRGYNELSWNTASEMNNSHFDVERSSDGQHFSKIGEQAGAGTNLDLSEYLYVDSNPLEGVSYYKLKQVDFNGQYKYSDVIAVSQTERNDFDVVSAYPNPTSKVFNIQINLAEQDEIEISVNELNGTLINHFSKVYQKGGQLIELSVENYSKGMYFVSVTNTRTNKSELIKLSIQ